MEIHGNKVTFDDEDQKIIGEQNSIDIGSAYDIYLETVDDIRETEQERASAWDYLQPHERAILIQKLGQLHRKSAVMLDLSSIALRRELDEGLNLDQK